MEKNKLSKHHFWILLALAVVLIPVVIGGATFGVGSAADAEQKKINGEIDKLAKATTKGQKYIEGLKEQEKYLQARKSVVWKDAYEDQTGLIEWPSRLSHLDPLYFGDPIGTVDLNLIQNNKAAYLGEYEKFADIIKPTRFLGYNWWVVGYVPEPWPVVPTYEEAWLALEDLCLRRELLKDIQAINRFLARCLPVPGSPPPPFDLKPPDPKAYESNPDELKTLQAEYAKKKEEYDQQKADYERSKVDTEKELREYLKPKPGEGFGRFISPYWRIDLAVRRGDSRAGEHIFRGRITNVSLRRQNIDKVEFKVYFQKPEDPATQPAILKLNQEFLAAGETYEFDEVKSIFTAPSLNILAVEQTLDEKFAPVKRVDRLALYYQSNRYAANGQPLQMTKFSQKEVEAAAQATPAGGPPGMPGGPPGGPPVGAPGGDMGDRGGPGGAMMQTNYTKNGMTRQRYVHMTEQVRRMPIGVVLVVDQMHVQDVVRAFANSRLRFQNTQFHWQRFHGSLGFDAPNMAGGEAGGPGMPGAFDPRRGPGMPGSSEDRPGRGVPGGVMGRSTGGGAPTGGAPRGDVGAAGSGGPPFGGPPFRGGPPFGGPNWNQTGLPDEGTSNLVELCVYGIASIYEKYPPKPSADAGATPPAPGADVGPATPPAPPTGATPPAAAPPVPATGTSPPPAAPTPPMPPGGTGAPPANTTPPAPVPGINPPLANAPPMPPGGTGTPPAPPPANKPPPGNPM
jgi:hypothetical protein